MGGVFANGLEDLRQGGQRPHDSRLPRHLFHPAREPGYSSGRPGSLSELRLRFRHRGRHRYGLYRRQDGQHQEQVGPVEDLGDRGGLRGEEGGGHLQEQGKSYFHKWSNNVKFDGEPVIRNTDLASHNHASPGPNSPPWVHLAEAHLGRTLTPDEEKCPPIGPYNRIDCGSGSGSHAHHIVPDMCYRTGRRGSSDPRVPGAPSLGEGMCICLKHNQHSGLHSSLNGNLRTLGSTPIPASNLPSGAPTVTGTAPIEDIFDECANYCTTRFLVCRLNARRSRSK